MTLAPNQFGDASIFDLAAHCNTELDILLAKIGGEEIVEDRLSSGSFIPLKNGLVAIARQIEKMREAIAEAEHDTTWRRDDEETEHTHQRREYFDAIAPGGRL